MGANDSRPADDEVGSKLDFGCDVVPSVVARDESEISKSRPLQVVKRNTFPIPEGWRVVCRLSPTDPRAGWGCKPRPAKLGAKASKLNGRSDTFEANVVAPELRQPLRVPLQLLPQWVEPEVGKLFLDRFQVLKAMPAMGGARGRLFFEVADKSLGNVKRCLRILDLAGEADVRAFAERLQLESLDSTGGLFVRLHDLSVALPGRMAAVEDAIVGTLWQEFAKVSIGQELVAKVGAVANAVLSGLCRLHANGWVHCNVSPDSIVLTDDGCWKLAGLERARRVTDMKRQHVLDLGTAVPPEALLDLPITEKVDIWQLGATLAESILQVRVDSSKSSQAASVDVASWLCKLIDFTGPIPESLITGHPHREALFTPQGHLLRPSTPDAKGLQVIEAIEPFASPSVVATDGRAVPRPPQLAKKLKDAECAPDILDFIGRLLSADPEMRPSAGETLAHHFIRFAHAKGETRKSTIEEEKHVTSDKTIKATEMGGHKERAVIQDNHKDNESRIVRNGTGFVKLSDLPSSDDGDEEVSPKTLVKLRDDCSNSHECRTPQRKGTGFVNIFDLPPESDDEMNVGAQRRLVIQDSHGDNENKITRKGTGFVNLSDLPQSDDEDAEDARNGGRQPHFQDLQKDTENTITRKGTGFVNLSDLPGSDDDDEDQ